MEEKYQKIRQKKKKKKEDKIVKMGEMDEENDERVSERTIKKKKSKLPHENAVDAIVVP